MPKDNFVWFYEGDRARSKQAAQRMFGILCARLWKKNHQFLPEW